MENEVKEPVPQYNFISPQQYLETERTAPDKHEYYKGEVFAMSGASLEHNIISRNIMVWLGGKLKGGGCQPFGSDLRIHIPLNTLFTYPDLTIFCDKPLLTENSFDSATNPSVIVEILSPSTRNYDMGIKFMLYRDIESLKEYILIDSETVYIQKHLRQQDNSWVLTEIKDIRESLYIHTIEHTIPLTEIYEGISF